MRLSLRCGRLGLRCRRRRRWLLLLRRLLRALRLARALDHLHRLDDFLRGMQEAISSHNDPMAQNGTGITVGVGLGWRIGEEVQPDNSTNYRDPAYTVAENLFFHGHLGPGTGHFQVGCFKSRASAGA